LRAKSRGGSYRQKVPQEAALNRGNLHGIYDYVRLLCAQRRTTFVSNAREVKKIDEIATRILELAPGRRVEVMDQRWWVRSSGTMARGTWRRQQRETQEP